MNLIFKTLCLINFSRSEAKSNRTLSEASKVLINRINQCKAAIELKDCENQFKEIQKSYSGDLSLETFERTISKQIALQSGFIELENIIRTTKRNPTYKKLKRTYSCQISN